MKNIAVNPNKIFRPVEFWKSVLITMPDNSFFELMRSIFGKIKTPFKKQQLVNDLEAFLLREDIQKTIKAYIDQNDAKIIAATALFGEPTEDNLENFFAGELNRARLQDIIVNLEERFILYRFTEEKTSRIALNPVLKQILIPFALDISPLFPAQKQSSCKEAAVQLMFNDRILAAVYSFVSTEEHFFKAENVISKRTGENAKNCFPGMDTEMIFGSLQVLGLLYVDADRLVPDKKRFDDFGLLSAQERSEYCAAALMVYNELSAQKEILFPLYRGRIREYAIFIHDFLDSLETEYFYPEKILHKLVEILKVKANIVNITNALNSSTFLDTLEKTGLLLTNDEQLTMRAGITKTVTNTKKNEPLIAIDSGFSVVVFPEIEYADAISLAAILEIQEAGGNPAASIVRFQLSKDSAVRAFNRNISADEIIDLLKRLSCGRIDDNLIWTLKDWEKRYGEVSLKKGVILSLSEDRRYLTETRQLSKLIIETLAPGLYLLPEDAINDAARALNHAGVDIIGRGNKTGNKTADFTQTSNYFSSLANKLAMSSRQDSTEHSPAAGISEDQAGRSNVLTENFHAILKKIPASESERAELSARINRRLVLSESQLKETDLRYEKLEARNMDYAGKQNIAKQAISMQCPVEIEVVLPGEEKSERIFGVPKSLEKEGEKLILVIKPDNEQDTMLRIPLGKISLIRRIKKSIFQ